MGPKRECGDDAEVAAAAAQRPKEIRVLRLARFHERRVGEDDVGFHEMVDGEAELARQVADAASERETADSRRAERARRHCEAVPVRRVIDVGEGASAADLHEPRLRIDPNPPLRRQVDHEPSLRDCESGPAMAAAPNRSLEALRAREGDRDCDVRCVEAANDRGGPLVDAAVVDLPRVVVDRVLRRDDFAADSAAKLVEAGQRRKNRHGAPFREMPETVGGSYHCVAPGTSDARVPRPRRAGIAASRDATYAFVLISDRMGSSSSLSRRARSTGDDAFQLAEERTLELARLAGVKDRRTFERGARLVHFDCVSVDEILITPTFRKRGYWEPGDTAQGTS